MRRVNLSGLQGREGPLRQSPPPHCWPRAGGSPSWSSGGGGCPPTASLDTPASNNLPELKLTCQEPVQPPLEDSKRRRIHGVLCWRVPALNGGRCSAGAWCFKFAFLRLGFPLSAGRYVPPLLPGDPSVPGTVPRGRRGEAGRARLARGITTLRFHRCCRKVRARLFLPEM